MAKRLQTYDSPDITVTFDPNICRHTGVCLRTLAPVFDIRRRKWIDTLAAPAQDIAAAVRKCPSGALQYRWHSAEPDRSALPAIRAAGAADAAALAQFGERTFRAAFEAENRREDVDAYVGATYTATQFAADLADPARTTLIAEAGGAPAAYAQLRAGEAPAEVTGAAPIELLRFYVDPAWQGRGLAQSLMDATIAAARERGAGTLWLGVWERNPRGIAFYVKCGFRDAGSKPFLLGTDWQTDRVMVRPL